MNVMKKAAALRAAEEVRDGMKLGLGTGSTAKHFVDAVGAKVASGMSLVCVPTSEATRAQAAALNIPLAELGVLGRLDLTVDGADELDADLRLIKGGGAALLREKIVAAASDRMVVIADASKRVAHLGGFALPVEVNPFAHATTAAAIAVALAGTGNAGAVDLRMQEGQPLVTDGGHYIYDLALGRIHAPEALAADLNMIPGVVETGLFINMANGAVIASADGIIELGEVSAA